jgi:hypothetical protein
MPGNQNNKVRKQHLDLDITDNLTYGNISTLLATISSE